MTVASARAFRSTAATKSSVPAPWASPGPISSARVLSVANEESWAAAPVATMPGCASASGKKVTFGSSPAIASATDRAVATVTTPAPHRSAARDAMSVAPG